LRKAHAWGTQAVATSDDFDEQPAVKKAVEDSRWILALTPGWDDESARTCEGAWRRATAHLLLSAAWVGDHLHARLPAPVIMPLADGSIDLHWKTSSRELLINVPEGPAQGATYYGDGHATQPVRGDFDPAGIHEELLNWLLTPTIGRPSTSLTQIDCTIASTAAG